MGENDREESKDDFDNEAVPINATSAQKMKYGRKSTNIKMQQRNDQ